MDERSPEHEDVAPQDTTEAPEPSRSDAALAQDLSGLRRVVYTVRLYGADHEHAREHAHEIMAQLGPRLQQFGAVDLEVKGEALEFRGIPVIQDPPQGGLADELYRDGIRVLTLRAGLSVDEFLEFLSILGTNFYLPQHQEDTLQGLLWAADLPHIGYEAVHGVEEAVEDSADAGRGEAVNFDEICSRIMATDQYTLGQGEYILQEELQLFDDVRYPAAPDLPVMEDEGGGTAGRAFDPFGDEFGDGDGDGSGTDQGFDDDLGSSGDFDSLDGFDDESDSDFDLAGATAITDDGEDDEEASAEPTGAPEDSKTTAERNVLAQAFGGGISGAGSWRSTASLRTLEFADGERDELEVPPQELLAIWEEADRDDTSDLLDKTIAFLVHTSLLGDSGLDIVQAASLMEACLKQSAEAGLVGRYVTTVEALRGFSDAEDAEAAGIALELVNRLLDIEMLVILAGQLDPEDASASRRFEDLLEIGGPLRVRAMLDVATDLEDDVFRRYLVQRIVTALKGDPGSLTEGLHRMDTAHLRIRLEALARMESYSARDQLAALLGHSNAEIRRAAVELLPSSHVRHVWKRLATMLAEDRDLDVRCAIIHRMDQDRLPALVPLLKRMVSAESFHKRDAGEKELALFTLAEDGGDAAVQTLGELLNAKVRMVSPRQSETRRMAALGLARIHTAASRRLLRQAANSLQPGLRRAAKEAIEAGEGGGRG